ncbi:hypothetical protein D3C79_822030 [compost metagenome]
MRCPTAEHAHGGPVHGRTEQQNDIAQYQGNGVWGYAAQADQRHAKGGEQQRAGKIAQGLFARATAPGVQGQQTHQTEDEYGHQQQGGDAQQHVFRSPCGLAANRPIPIFSGMLAERMVLCQHSGRRPMSCG